MRDVILDLCQELGIIVNHPKSNLIPSQVGVYLGVTLNSMTLMGSPVPRRIDKFLALVEEFLSSGAQPAKLWRILLGHLASLIGLVPGGRLRMRPLQLVLRRSWDFQDESFLVAWVSHSLEDLRWWSDRDRLERGRPT